MVSKCANSSCSGTFRYLHEGRLFHLAVGPATADKIGNQGTSRLERFWLCGECSKTMTVVSHLAGILVVPLRHLDGTPNEQKRARPRKSTKSV